MAVKRRFLEVASNQLALRPDGRLQLYNHSSFDGVSTPGVGNEAASEHPIPLHQWVHVACVIADESAPRLYVNGQLVAEAPRNDQWLIRGNNRFQIGGASQLRDAFAGSIADWALFARPLKEADIAAIFELTKQTYVPEG